MSKAQHHDIMEIVRADGWPDLFACLRPGDDPRSTEGERLRGRVNEILFGFAAARSALKDPSPAYDFLQYAELGETFLRGIKLGHAWMNLVAGALSTNPKRPSAGIAPPSIDIEAIERQINFLKSIHKFGEDVLSSNYQTEAPSSPNSKPWLHEAVADFRLLWLDEGQAGRPKKDFLNFVEALVGGTFGVTSNSILESYDRHSHKLLAEKLQIREGRQRYDARKKAIIPD